MQESGQMPALFLDRHVAGYWGEVDAEGWRLNDEALKNDSRVLSAYRTLKGVKLWVITEAVDDNGKRAATTLLASGFR